MKRGIVFLGFWVVMYTTVFAQTERWKSFSNKDAVRALEMEGNKVWVGSTQGVEVRDLDGKIINEYTKIGTMRSNNISCLHVDKQGVKWFGTSEGITKFEGTEWTSYTSTNSGFVSNGAVALTTDVEGNLWAIKYGGGVSKFDGEIWTSYTTANSGLKSNFLNTLASDVSGNVWFGAYNGISKFDGVTWTNYTTSNSGLVSNYINTITTDSLGNIWIGTKDGGISKFDGTTWISYTTSNSGLMSNNVNALISDAIGNIWIRTNSRVSKFDGTTWVDYNPGDSDLIAFSVGPLTTDGLGNLWVGTSGGILKFNGENWTSYNKLDSGLVSNSIYSLTIDIQGNKWIGSGRQSVYKFDDTTWTGYTTSNSGLVSNSIDVLETYIEGDLWVGTYGGISKFDGVTWTNYTTSNSGLVNNWVKAFAKDFEGNLWIGTVEGVSKFDGTVWTNYTTSSGMVSNSINTLIVDKQGKVWLGTDEGISKFDGVTWTNYTTSNSGLVDNFVNDFTIDISNNLWVGTALNGLSKFDGINWTSYTTSNSGLINNLVRSIISDSHGGVWVGTDDGLSKFDGTTWKSYTASNSGLIYDRVNILITDAKDNLWIGTDGGGISVFYDSGVVKDARIITGSVFLDKDQNTQKESEEPYLAAQRVNIQPGNRVAFTDTAGRYFFKAELGKTFTVSYFPTRDYALTKDTVYSFQINEKTIVPDFAIYREDTTSITSSITVDRARCGANSFVWYTYTNTGTISGEAKIEITVDDDIEIVSSYPAYDSLANNKVYFNIPHFTEGSQVQYRLTVQNPDFTRLGDSLLYNSTLKMNGGIFEQNSSAIVRCSYDPNDKAVLPLPVGEENYTLKNEVLTYTIRFQNMGNDTAYKVVILDTLDEWFDTGTLEIVGQSHLVNTVLNEDNELVFTFDNIYLPDSITNEKESHGFVSYTIRTKSAVPEFTVVKNTAHIYFDSNPAVVTNTTENTMVTSFPIVSAINESSFNSTIQLVPNPISVRGTLRFENNQGTATLRMLSMSGVEVFNRETTGNQFDFSKTDFPNSGMYFYQLQTAEKYTSGKLIVE